MSPSADRLREFQKVVELGSITAASRELRIPRATLSRRMSELEETLGVRLIRRTTRRLDLTQAGTELFTRACRLVSDVDAAWDAVRRHDDGIVRGRLRVAVPDSEMAAARFFIDFARDYPEVNLEVIATNGYVDLRSEGFDVGLFFGEIRDQGLIARRLHLSTDHLLASTAYLDRVGGIASIDELKDHPAVVSLDTFGQPMTRWPLRNGETISITPHFVTNGFRLMLRAIEAGVGVGLAPVGCTSEAIANGSLTVLFQEEVGEEHPFSLVYVDRKFQLPQVKAFIDRASGYWKAWITQWNTEPGSVTLFLNQ